MASLLNLTQHQRKLLQQLRSDYERLLLQIKFNEPEKDHLYIRQHASIYGKVEVLTEILDEEQSASDSQQRVLDQLIDGPQPPEDGFGF
jgi:hypothetical protein